MPQYSPEDDDLIAPGSSSPADVTGSAPSLGISAPAGSASNSALASGTPPSLTMIAPTGGAFGEAASIDDDALIVSVATAIPANASGVPPALTMTAPAGSASGSTTASSGLFPAGYFPQGYFPQGYFQDGSGSPGAGNASGVPPSLTMAAPTGSASGVTTSAGTSSVDDDFLISSQGGSSGGSAGNASGVPPSLAMTAPAASASGGIPSTGAADDDDLLASPTAAGFAFASGVPPSLTMAAPPGSAFAASVAGTPDDDDTLIVDAGASGILPLPISVQGAILSRFRSTPALVAAVPGGLWPAVPTGKTAIPYATIVHVAGVTRHTTGVGGYYVVDDRFQVAIAGRTNADCRAAFDAFQATFNSRKVTGGNPLPMVNGNVFTSYVADERMSAGAEPDKGNNRVYRLIFTLATKASRLLNP